MPSKLRRSYKKKKRSVRRTMRQSGGKKELVELIIGDESSLIPDEADAIKQLTALDANIRLDLHGVLDIIPEDKKIKKHEHDKICVISFVGRNSTTRTDAREEIKRRIKNNQIDFGLLVFDRGSGSKRDIFSKAGGKAWANKHIKCTEKCVFIDDSSDHVNSTVSLLGDSPVKSVHFESEDPKEIIEKIYESLA